MLRRMMPNETRPKWRDKNARDGSFSTSFVVCGTAQRKNGGYIRYAQTNATVVPRTPPNPSSRSGFACTISRLAKPNEAHTIDQNEGGNVIRQASIARSGDSLPKRCERSARVCQLNVM